MGGEAARSVRAVLSMRCAISAMHAMVRVGDAQSLTCVAEPHEEQGEVESRERGVPEAAVGGARLESPGGGDGRGRHAAGQPQHRQQGLRGRRRWEAPDAAGDPLRGDHEAGAPDGPEHGDERVARREQPLEGRGLPRGQLRLRARENRARNENFAMSRSRVPTREALGGADGLRQADAGGV